MTIGDLIVNLKLDAEHYLESSRAVIDVTNKITDSLDEMGTAAVKAGRAVATQGGAMASSVGRAAVATAAAAQGMVQRVLASISSIHPVVAALVNVIQTTVSAVVDSIWAIAGGVWEVTKSLFSGIKAAFSAFASYATTIVTVVAVAVAAEYLTVGLATGVILRAILTATALLLVRLATAIVGTMWEMAKTITSVLGTVLSSIGSVLYAIGSAVWEIAKAIGSAIVGVFSAIKDIITSTFSAVASFFTQSTDSVGGLIMALTGYTILLETAKALWEGMKNAASSVAQMESTQAAINVLVGENQGVELYRQMEEYALKTSFSINDVTVATQKLLAAGLAAGDILPIMDMLGNLAMGNTVKLSFLTKALSDVKTKGRLMGQEIRQFAEHGIGVVPALAMEMFGDTTAASTAEVQRLSEAGQISYTTLKNALMGLTSGQGRFAGLLGATALTVGGKWQMMTERLSVNLRNFTSLLFDAFNVKGILDELLKMLEWVGRGIAALKPVATAMHDMFIRNWASIKDALSRFGAWVAGWARTGWLGPLAWAIVYVKDNFDWLVEALTFGFNHIGEIADYAAAHLAYTFNVAYADIGFFFTTTLPEIFENLKTIWSAVLVDMGIYVMQFIQNMKDNMGVLFSSITAMAKTQWIEFKYATLDEADVLPGAAGRKIERDAAKAAELAELAKSVGTFKSPFEGMQAPTATLSAIQNMGPLSQRTPSLAEIMEGMALGMKGGEIANKFSEFLGRERPPAPEAVKLEMGTDEDTRKEEAGPKNKFGGALERGSQDAYSAILAAMGGGDSLKVAKDQLAIERQMLAEIKKGNAADARIPNVESFA